MKTEQMKKLVARNAMTIALSAGLLLAAVLCAYQQQAQQQLAAKLTRLHIIASSDSEEDQAVKLLVRDFILESGRKAGLNTAAGVTPSMLCDIENWANEALKNIGSADSARATLENVFIDTRSYEYFSLPAGNYDAVRVIIGEGQGKNWWCVLFPPLCNGVAEGDADEALLGSGLNEDEISYITEDGTTYVVRFKLAEMIGKLSNAFK